MSLQSGWHTRPCAINQKWLSLYALGGTNLVVNLLQGTNTLRQLRDSLM